MIHLNGLFLVGVVKIILIPKNYITFLYFYLPIEGIEGYFHSEKELEDSILQDDDKIQKLLKFYRIERICKRKKQ